MTANITSPISSVSPISSSKDNSLDTSKKNILNSNEDDEDEDLADLAASIASSSTPTPKGNRMTTENTRSRRTSSDLIAEGIMPSPFKVFFDASMIPERVVDRRVHPARPAGIVDNILSDKREFVDHKLSLLVKPEAFNAAKAMVEAENNTEVFMSLFAAHTEKEKEYNKAKESVLLSVGDDAAVAEYFLPRIEKSFLSHIEDYENGIRQHPDAASKRRLKANNETHERFVKAGQGLTGAHKIIFDALCELLAEHCGVEQKTGGSRRGRRGDGTNLLVDGGSRLVNVNLVYPQVKDENGRLVSDKDAPAKSATVNIPFAMETVKDTQQATVACFVADGVTVALTVLETGSATLTKAELLARMDEFLERFTFGSNTEQTTQE